jgi:lipopolysaccharide/colanic/teichoic acid biosynthesis glycosyltransferase
MFLAVDLTAIFGGLYVARGLRVSTAGFLGLFSIRPLIRFEFLLILAAIWMLSLAAFRLYMRDYCVAGVEEYRRIVLASFAALFAGGALAFAIEEPLSRGFLVFGWLLVTVALSVGRFAIRRFVYRRARDGHRLDRVLIVGASKQGLAMARRLQENPTASTHVCGFLDEYRPVGAQIGESFQILGEPLDLWRVAAQCGATRAILIQSALTWESQYALIQRMHRRSDLKLLLAPGMLDLNATPLEMRQLGPVLLAAPRRARIVGVDAVIKRTLDLVIAGMLLGLTGPLLACVCVWSRIARQRWPIARRTVIGWSGRRLQLIEIVGLDWVERAHLARLPNLLLVLGGRLSIVGPRPVSVAELPAYKEWAELLMSVRPGLVGPWWVAPREPEEEIQFDIRYLQTYSAWSDLQILWHSLRGLIPLPLPRVPKARAPRRGAPQVPGGKVVRSGPVGPEPVPAGTGPHDSGAHG